MDQLQDPYRDGNAKKGGDEIIKKPPSSICSRPIGYSSTNLGKGCSHLTHYTFLVLGLAASTTGFASPEKHLAGVWTGQMVIDRSKLAKPKSDAEAHLLDQRVAGAKKIRFTMTLAPNHTVKLRTAFGSSKNAKNTETEELGKWKLSGSLVVVSTTSLNGRPFHGTSTYSLDRKFWRLSGKSFEPGATVVFVKTRALASSDVQAKVSTNLH